MKHVLTRLLVLVVAGCGHRRTERLAQRTYLLEAPQGQWVAVSGGSADHSWYQPDLSAMIYADANCGSRYEDGKLEDLLTHLSFGVAGGGPTDERVLTLDGRDAMQRTWTGQLDGVPVAIAATVIKKDACLYDVLYIAPPGTFGAGLDAYEAVVQSFRTTGGGP